MDRDEKDVVSEATNDGDFDAGVEGGDDGEVDAGVDVGEIEALIDAAQESASDAEVTVDDDGPVRMDTGNDDASDITDVAIGSDASGVADVAPTPVCTPGDARCAGNAPETCDGGGQWQKAASCSGAQAKCRTGACIPTNPSCASLAATCGAGLDDTCCADAVVPKSTYKRSYDDVTFTNANYPASISELRLDTYEVTVGRFRAFVEGGSSTQASPPPVDSGANPHIAASGWKAAWNTSLAKTVASLRSSLACNAAFATWTDSPGPNENRPINCVTWYDAFAFCAWDGGRLPTEAEWNMAAAGGDDQRVYPWSVPSTSSSIDGTRASYWVDGTKLCFGDGVNGCALTDLVLVGTKPLGAGRWGHADLAGNVWEWVLDVYHNPYATSSCADCADLSSGSDRVTRGGAFSGTASTLRASTRSFAPPSSRFYTQGIRCARTP
jgi:formylglycine-generating enzyme required for sulfatase activity